MRLGVCAWIYGDAPLEDTLARIAAAGYDGVELPGEPDRWSADEVRRLLARYRLAPLALTASCMVPQTPRDLAHPDPRIRDQAVRYVTDCLRFAADVGAPLVQMLPSGETRLAPMAPREDEWRWSVDAMRAAAVQAERLGVRIAVEPLNRYEAYLVTTVEEALRYVTDVGSPWVGVTFDAFHANIEEPDLPGAIRAAGPRLWHVHLADSNRQGLGRGHLDATSVLEALRGIGYQGAAVLEVMPPGPDPFRSIKDANSPAVLDTYLAESLARLRRLDHP
ncbi:MAG: sugar phosphate isomerase/epimerase family protein [Armatimonadota bacterium]|nr:sugar phosphate isomerase/epimerase family protein [Armatimonadota bacterium]MDR7520480.1 sugar phosphate isomerase/epimerase family protein [Armatimonadota bacterium]MDR7548940.1 sugar phosphate isomerase/epimerase family protein [Armatimonadota bacterium]